MWIEGFLLGAVVGVVAVWLGIAGIFPVVVLLGFLALVPDGRTRAGGGLVGLGAGMAAITINAAASCPAVLGFASDSCSGPDLRTLLALAVGLGLAGFVLTIRRGRQT